MLADHLRAYTGACRVVSIGFPKREDHDTCLLDFRWTTASSPTRCFECVSVSLLCCIVLSVERPWGSDSVSQVAISEFAEGSIRRKPSSRISHTAVGQRCALTLQIRL